MNLRCKAETYHYHICDYNLFELKYFTVLHTKHYPHKHILNRQASTMIFTAIRHTRERYCYKGRHTYAQEWYWKGFHQQRQISSFVMLTQSLQPIVGLVLCVSSSGDHTSVLVSIVCQVFPKFVTGILLPRKTWYIYIYIYIYTHTHTHTHTLCKERLAKIFVLRRRIHHLISFYYDVYVPTQTEENLSYLQFNSYSFLL